MLANLGEMAVLFLPTPSARRATPHISASLSLIAFLPTPSARRATPARQAAEGSHLDFYPRPPRGGRHDYGNNNAQVVQFLPTPSARRATISPKLASIGL